MSDGTEDMNKAQRLALAAAVAPDLRSGGSRRRIRVYDQRGVTPETPTCELPITAEMPLGDAQLGMLRRLNVEIAFQEDIRSEIFICLTCQRPAKQSLRGRPRKY